MKVKGFFLKNIVELQRYNEVVAEYGYDEAFNLGKVNEPIEPIYVTNDFIFKMSDVQTAWMVHDPNVSINIKMSDGDMWSVEYTDELWNKLEEHLI